MTRISDYFFFVAFWLLLTSSSMRITATEESDRTKIYALHFPQFHNDRLNSEIWGDGFTDWNNLNKTPALNRLGRTILRPHRDVGYYDQASYQTRKLQGDLARKYGIDGFIYHHYWFHYHGEHATLSTPLERMLVDGEPSIPFAFNWAAESWTSTWQGVTKKRTRGLLHDQFCPMKNDSRISLHYQFLKKFFHHPKYIKVHGMPLFHFFRHQQPPKKDTCYHLLERLQELAVADGFPSPGLYVLHSENDVGRHEIYSKQLPPSAFEAANNNLPPNNMKLKRPISSFEPAGLFYYPYTQRLYGNVTTIPARCFSRDFAPSIYPKPQYLSSVVHFDNTPRRHFNHSIVWDRSQLLVTVELGAGQGGDQAASWRDRSLTPGRSLELDLLHLLLYERCCQEPTIRERGGQFVVVNAWNEWGEGMALEPSSTWGYQFLEAVTKAKAAAAKIVSSSSSSSSAASCDWAKYRGYLQEILS